VSAKDEERALSKIQEELTKPFGFLGSWQTVETGAEILSVESNAVYPTGPLPDGLMMLSVKTAAKQLGISYTTLYGLMNGGEIEYVRIGQRRLLSRDALQKFIETNSQTGYSRYER
jgi:excisionase family DNA binding protein